MKIDKIIFASDDNPKYLGVWKYVSRVCREILDVEPVLFHITNEDSEFFRDEYGIVKKVTAIPNCKTSIQAQFYRIYGTSYFFNETCLISDIDMITPNREYFINQVKKFDENSFVVYSSDVYNENLPYVHKMYYKNRLPICYFSGKGKIYQKIFEIDSDFSVFLHKALSYELGYDVPYGDRDEVYCGYKIHQSENEHKIIKLNRNVTDIWNIPNRIEKKQFFDLEMKEIESKKIIDFHIPSDYFQKIVHFEEIYSKILESYKN